MTGEVSKSKAQSSNAVTHGRSNVAAAIHEVVVERSGSLAVIACGPAPLADDARAAFVAELKDRQRDMELFMEAFNW